MDWRRSDRASPGRSPRCRVSAGPRRGTAWLAGSPGCSADALCERGNQPGGPSVRSPFFASACGPCPARGLCTAGKRRQLSLLPRDLAKAQAAARTAVKTIPFQADYARRAGVEGTVHQAASHGARRDRYRGLPTTRLDHVYMACALNLLRLGAFWTGTPRDRQRTSHLARLELGLAA